MNAKKRILSTLFLIFYATQTHTFDYQENHTENLETKIMSLELKIKELEILILQNVMMLQKMENLLLHSQLHQDHDEILSDGDDEYSAQTTQENQDEDHRLTIRIPKWLMPKIDAKRKQRVGKISRNLWIIEVIDRATKK